MQHQDPSRPAQAWLPMLPDTFRTTRTTGALARPGPLRERAGDDLRHSSSDEPVADPGDARGWRSFFGTVSVFALLWTGLAGPDPASWVIGAPVVAIATALRFAFAPARRLRLSLLGTIRFLGWFAVASFRGATDVAGRALAWRVPLAPGIRTYHTDLPAGAPRLVFINAITLLPGTLSAEINGGSIDVHMLDTRVDLAAELAPLEARVRVLFALPTLSRNTPLDMEVRK